MTPHRGTSLDSSRLAEAGFYGMLNYKLASLRSIDVSVLMQQHAQKGEGLAVFQTSHLPGAIMVSRAKDHNLYLGDAVDEAIGFTA